MLIIDFILISAIFPKTQGISLSNQTMKGSILMILLGMSLLLISVQAKCRSDSSSESKSDERHSKPPKRGFCSFNICNKPYIKIYLDCLADPGCQTLCICSNGLPYAFHCPGILVFNIKKLTCDWPWNVPNCC
jgi:hypothetical protein